MLNFKLSIHPVHPLNWFSLWKNSSSSPEAIFPLLPSVVMNVEWDGGEKQRSFVLLETSVNKTCEHVISAIHSWHSLSKQRILLLLIARWKVSKREKHVKWCKQWKSSRQMWNKMRELTLATAPCWVYDLHWRFWRQNSVETAINSNSLIKVKAESVWLANRKIAGNSFPADAFIRLSQWKLSAAKTFSFNFFVSPN